MPRIRTRPHFLTLPQSISIRILSFLDVDIELTFPLVSKRCYDLSHIYCSFPLSKSLNSSSSFTLSLSSPVLQTLFPYLTYTTLLSTFPLLSKQCSTIFFNYLRTLRGASFINDMEPVVIRIMRLAPALRTISLLGHSRLSSVSLCALGDDAQLCPRLTQIHMDRIPSVTAGQLTTLYRIRPSLSCTLRDDPLYPEFMELGDVLRAPEGQFNTFVDFLRPLSESDYALFWRRVNSYEEAGLTDQYSAKQQIVKLWFQFLARGSPFEIKVESSVWHGTKKWVDMIRTPAESGKAEKSATTTIITPTPPSRSVINPSRKVPPSPALSTASSFVDHWGTLPPPKPKTVIQDELVVPPEYPSLTKTFFRPPQLEVDDSSTTHNKRKSTPRLGGSIPGETILPSIPTKADPAGSKIRYSPIITSLSLEDSRKKDAEIPLVSRAFNKLTHSSSVETSSPETPTSIKITELDESNYRQESPVSPGIDIIISKARIPEELELPLSESASGLSTMEVKSVSKGENEVIEAECPLTYVFSQLQDHIYLILLRNAFPAFKQTPQYQIIARSLDEVIIESKCACCIIL